MKALHKKSQDSKTLRPINPAIAVTVAGEIGMDLEDFDLDEFCMGLTVELEHGFCDPDTNVTNNDLVTTGKIAWAHLKEIPDYYTRLNKMEQEAKADWRKIARRLQKKDGIHA